MRLCVLFLTTILVSFSIQVSAAAPTPHLRDYVLSAEDIAKLSPKDQASYMTFLYNFIATVEMSQAKIEPEPESTVDALFRKAFDFYAHLHFIERAEAQCVPGPCPRGQAGNLSQFALFGARPDKYPAGWLLFSQKAQSEYLAAYRARVALSMQASQSTPHTSPPKKKRSPRRRIARRPRPSAPAEDGTVASADSAAGSEADADRAPATGYRQAGSACLFGGYVSHYEAKSNGALNCPAPAGKMNAEPCLGTTRAPKFNCNNFGMATGPAQAAVQTTTCVDGKPLADLTVRCVGALDKWLADSPPTTMDAAAYTAWRTQVTTALDEYENRFAAAKKFSDYCENDNAVNENRQKDECAALSGLFAKLRALSPAAGAAVDRAAAQPATPGYREGDVRALTPAASNTPAPRATAVAPPAPGTPVEVRAAPSAVLAPARQPVDTTTGRRPGGPQPGVQSITPSAN